MRARVCVCAQAAAAVHARLLASTRRPTSLPQVGEVLDYWGDAGAIAWRLTDNDVRQVLSQRVDFSSHEILALKL